MATLGAHTPLSATLPLERISLRAAGRKAMAFCSTSRIVEPWLRMWPSRSNTVSASSGESPSEGSSSISSEGKFIIARPIASQTLHTAVRGHWVAYLDGTSMMP